MLTAGFGLPLRDGVAVQEKDGAERGCVQVLLLPGPIELAGRLQQAQGHVSNEHSWGKRKEARREAKCLCRQSSRSVQVPK